MNTKKLLIGSVVGTVAVFLLDYLIYAVLLTDIFAPVPGCERSPMPDFAWLIPGLFIVLFGFTYIYLKGVEGGSKVQQGIRYGLIFALIIGVGYNLIMYSLMTTHPLSYYLYDAVYNLVRWPIAGIVVAYATGVPGTDRGKGPGGE
ncbi:MAG TPA: hypothetical protein VI603_11890 [Saprospiraceae bacterium]|nr:hypothetical protein [Saprospiraceae bacterium]